ncbi:MAG: hypothetical protein DIU56_009445 [Pseudomonadota bacterium]|jgi:hypothetical protein
MIQWTKLSEALPPFSEAVELCMEPEREKTARRAIRVGESMDGEPLWLDVATGAAFRASWRTAWWRPQPPRG